MVAGVIPSELVDSEYQKCLMFAVGRTTTFIAHCRSVSYYTALRRLKHMEELGLVKRVGVDRSDAFKPHILWVRK